MQLKIAVDTKSRHAERLGENLGKEFRCEIEEMKLTHVCQKM